MSRTTGPFQYPNPGPLLDAPLTLVDELSLFPGDGRRGGNPGYYGVVLDIGSPGFSSSANAAPAQLIGTSATLVAQAVAGGVFRVGSQNVDNAVGVLKLNGGAFKYTAGKGLWFVCRLAIDNVITGELIAGLALNTYAATDLGTLPTDGLFFLKAETATDITFHARNGGASTTVANLLTTAGLVLTADTMVELGFRVDLNGNVNVFVNGIPVGNVAAGDANLPTTSTDLLTPYIGRQAAGANIRYVDVDYYLAAGQR